KNSFCSSSSSDLFNFDPVIGYFKTATNGIVKENDPPGNSTNHLHHFCCFSSIWSSMQNITRRSVVEAIQRDFVAGPSTGTC
ncbi:hypothetical protein VIGAN_04306900, partial [Vigna angularis var. angularis]